MSIDLEQIKAICFDVDGTLSDTDDQWTSAIAKQLALFQRLFPHWEVHNFSRRVIMGVESPANLAYHLLDRANLDSHAGRLFNFFGQRLAGRKSHHFWLIQGVRDTVLQLSRVYPLSIVSARDETGTLAFLNQFQLRPSFQAVATALTCRYTKPFPDPILWAARQMGVAPENCLMVGDTTVDIRAGKSAGAQTVGVLCGFGQEDELRRAGADLILSHTAQLIDILPLKNEKPGQNT